jgi:hypothetical protein
MNRLAVGILIAIAALAMHAMSGGPARAAATDAPSPSATPVPAVPQAKRVLGLILALESVRAAPQVPNRPKV